MGQSCSSFASCRHVVVMIAGNGDGGPGNCVNNHGSSLDNKRMTLLNSNNNASKMDPHTDPIMLDVMRRSIEATEKLYNSNEAITTEATDCTGEQDVATTSATTTTTLGYPVAAHANHNDDSTSSSNKRSWTSKKKRSSSARTSTPTTVQHYGQYHLLYKYSSSSSALKNNTQQHRHHHPQIQILLQTPCQDDDDPNASAPVGRPHHLKKQQQQIDINVNSSCSTNNNMSESKPPRRTPNAAAADSTEPCSGSQQSASNMSSQQTDGKSLSDNNEHDNDAVVFQQSLNETQEQTTTQMLSTDGTYKAHIGHSESTNQTFLTVSGQTIRIGEELACPTRLLIRQRPVPQMSTVKTRCGNTNNNFDDHHHTAYGNRSTGGGNSSSNNNSNSGGNDSTSRNTMATHIYAIRYPDNDSLRKIVSGQDPDDEQQVGTPTVPQQEQCPPSARAQVHTPHDDGDMGSSPTMGTSSSTTLSPYSQGQSSASCKKTVTTLRAKSTKGSISHTNNNNHDLATSSSTHKQPTHHAAGTSKHVTSLATAATTSPNHNIASSGAPTDFFSRAAMASPPKCDVVEWVTISEEHNIYVVDVGLSAAQCDYLVNTTEHVCRGQYAAYTYAKQTLGCREYPALARASFLPVHTIVHAITKKFLPDRMAVDSTATESDKKNNGDTSPSSTPPSKSCRKLQLDDREPHVVKYDVTKKERQKLDMHTDKSEWTFLIALSNGCGVDYEGGGTYFECLDATVHIQRGHALVFPGKLRHCGQKITSGLRFLLVGFLVDKAPALAVTAAASANGTDATTIPSSSSC